MITSYAEIRSDATNKSFLESTTYNSRTFPEASSGRESPRLAVVYAMLRFEVFLDGLVCGKIVSTVTRNIVQYFRLQDIELS